MDDKNLLLIKCADGCRVGKADGLIVGRKDGSLVDGHVHVLGVRREDFSAGCVRAVGISNRFKNWTSRGFGLIRT